VVEQIVFGLASKSTLGYLLLGLINTGHREVFAGDESEYHIDVWRQASLAKYEMKANNLMRWYVDESKGHDDRLVSLALCCWAADLAAAPAEDAVVRPQLVGYETGWFGQRW
jgi:hypothetical protein